MARVTVGIRVRSGRRAAPADLVGLHLRGRGSTLSTDGHCGTIGE